MASPALLHLDHTIAAHSLRGGIASALLSAAAVALIAAAGIAGLVHLGILDLAALIGALRHVDPSLIVTVLALSLVNYALRAWRWHVLTRQLTDTVSLTASTAYYFTGFAFLLTPGKLGEMVRLWLLKSRHAVTYQRSLGLVVVDRISDLASLVVLGALGLLLHAEHAAAILGLALLLAVPLACLSSRRLVATCALLGNRLTGRRWPALFVFVLGADRALRRVCRPAVLLASLVLGLAAWAAQIGGVWLMLRAVGFDGGLLHAAFLYPVAILAGAAALVPGGADAVLAGMLAMTGLSGEAALTGTLLVRMATWWFAMLVGLVVAPMVLARR